MRICPICGGEVPQTRSGNNTKYCSLKCARVAEKNQNIRRISAKAQRHNSIAMYVYAAYKYKCALCEWQATEETISYKGKIQYAHGNEIHHITPVNEGGADEWNNVILLCPNHHKQADLEILSRDYLRERTVPYRLSEEQKAKAKSNCTDAVIAAIFGT